MFVTGRLCNRRTINVYLIGACICQYARINVDSTGHLSHPCAIVLQISVPEISAARACTSLRWSHVEQWDIIHLIFPHIQSRF